MTVLNFIKAHLNKLPGFRISLMKQMRYGNFHMWVVFSILEIQKSFICYLKGGCYLCDTIVKYMWNSPFKFTRQLQIFYVKKKINIYTWSLAKLMHSIYHSPLVDLQFTALAFKGQWLGKISLASPLDPHNFQNSEHWEMREPQQHRSFINSEITVYAYLPHWRVCGSGSSVLIAAGVYQLHCMQALTSTGVCINCWSIKTGQQVVGL